MKKNLFVLLTLVVLISILAACKGDDKAKEDNRKKEEPQTAKVQQTEEKIIKLGSLGFTPEEFKENWNASQAEMEESGKYKIESLEVVNGEFKSNISDGLILEGIVNEETEEVAKLALIKKYAETDQIEDSLNQFEDTIAAFFLLIAATNKEEKISEQEVGKLMKDLNLMNDTEDSLNTNATLNNVTYTAKETERGLVLTVGEKVNKD